MTPPADPASPTGADGPFGLTGGEAERVRRARRRAAARLHHPDLGGDPAVFARVMSELDAAGATPPTGSTTSTGTAATNPVVTVRATRRSPVARLVGATRRQVLHSVRTRIPRSLPGSRRYGHL